MKINKQDAFMAGFVILFYALSVIGLALVGKPNGSSILFNAIEVSATIILGIIAISISLKQTIISEEMKVLAEKQTLISEDLRLINILEEISKQIEILEEVDEYLQKLAMAFSLYPLLTAQRRIYNMPLEFQHDLMLKSKRFIDIDRDRFNVLKESLIRQHLKWLNAKGEEGEDMDFSRGKRNIKELLEPINYKLEELNSRKKTIEDRW
jgi:hypothetical protein